MDINPAATQKHVVLLGMNHTSSKVEIRDRILFVPSKIEAALTTLREDPYFTESLILSTCNRVEIYAVVEDPADAKDRLFNFISRFHKIDISEYRQYFYYFNCRKAIEHLYNVVASLDSLVIGEDQILVQVKEAYRIARGAGNTGTYLNKLFHFGIESGKRARSQTGIGDGIISISSAAVDLAGKILGELKTRTAMIIGAGEMSKLTAKHLVSAGIKKLYFANRTIENAVSMAEEFNGSALLLSDRAFVLHECDIVISSTGSPHFIITPEEINYVMSMRKYHPIFLIDIAAPRDIHPDVGRINNVFLYTMDDLSQVVEGTSQMRLHEIEKVHSIIEEDTREYYNWYSSLKVLPTLISLRHQFEELRDYELNKYSSEINGLPEPAQQLFRRFAQTLTQRLLNTPSKVIKDVATDCDSTVLIKSIATLFDLKVSQHE